MSLSWQHIKAIVIKEAFDLRKNSSILVMFFLPVLLTIIWDRVIPDMPGNMSLGFGLLFLVVMVGMYVPSMLLAEEKEKKTLQVLLLSPASPADVIVGKGLITFLSIVVISILLLFIVGPTAGNMLIIFVATFMVSIFSITVGMMVGLLSPDQRSTGTIGLPVYLLLLLIPQLAAISEGGIINLLARFLPTSYYLRILEIVVEENVGWGSVVYELLLIGISIVISFYVLHYIYRKKGIRGD
ncbi:MAG: ABC transporter permease [Halanaerobiaceae bacterium]